ncbi:MAG: hypothetical protein ACFUZC_00105 [Chthoniobacteraceae bacterium]
MNSLAIVYSVISLLILAAGLAAWYYTSSRSVAFLSFFGSIAILFSAYFIQTHTQEQLTYFIPFMIFALFAGRAIGIGYRSVKDAPLRVPSVLLGVASLLALGAAIAGFVNA